MNFNVILQKINRGFRDRYVDWDSAIAAMKEVALCSDCPPAEYPTDKTRCLPCPHRLPADVRHLVISARRAFELGYSDEEFLELDQALEAFSDRVPYDDEQ